MVQPSGNVIAPQLNVIRGNEVTDSGKADLAIAEGSAETNCFDDNAFESSLPAEIETVLGCGEGPATTGDPAVLVELGAPIPELLERLGPRPSYTEMPPPSAQPTMSDVGAPACPACRLRAPIPP